MQVPDARIPGVNALPLWVPGIVSGNGPYVPAAGGAPYVPAAPSAGPARGQARGGVSRGEPCRFVEGLIPFSVGSF